MTGELTPKADAVPVLALTPDQAAQALNISRSTLDRWTKQGKLPCKRDGKVVIYSLRALSAWLESEGADT